MINSDVAELGIAPHASSPAAQQMSAALPCRLDEGEAEKASGPAGAEKITNHVEPLHASAECRDLDNFCAPPAMALGVELASEIADAKSITYYTEPPHGAESPVLDDPCGATAIALGTNPTSRLIAAPPPMPLFRQQRAMRIRPSLPTLRSPNGAALSPDIEMTDDTTSSSDMGITLDSDLTKIEEDLKGLLEILDHEAHTSGQLKAMMALDKIGKKDG
ncbi:hypothetical protein QBC35DRAFT_545992, partial [Podospora australis]